MSKNHQRSNREKKKPKQDKPKSPKVQETFGKTVPIKSGQKKS